MSILLNRRHWVAICSLGGLVVVVPGCGASRSALVTGAERHLRVVGLEYGRFLSRQRGVAPENEEPFREFLASRLPRLAPLGVESVDQLLTSPHDGEPLVTLVAAHGQPMSPFGYPWAAYERSGVEGTHLAVSTRGTVVEMTSSEIEEAFGSSIE